ncbi:hypothetical protein F5887DRAFT_1081567 [Amanita rubescens]|nr:hypothetical protein F5887DRAFT_1081567 [Amanita rubescens]
MFPFTFKFPVPDIVNPFASTQIMSQRRSPSPPVIVSRKRTRVPEREYHEVNTQDLPPPDKRRRGLTDSIVSTALSAAFFSTAVGLTVYRLWRGSSEPRATDQLPPPPYRESEIERSPGPTSPKPSRKHRPGAGYSKRSNYRQRSTRARSNIPPALTSGTPELDFEPSTVLDEPVNEVDDQMDWIGDKLSVLIAEGKRALGCEIVVISDSKEDEVDDGSGAWEDSDPASSSLRTRTSRRRSHTTSASASTSQRRRRGHQQPDPGSIYQSFSASTSSLPQAPSTPRRTHRTGLSLDSSPASSGRLWTSSEDINTFDSPELRESMEKARQRALAARSGGQ